MTGKYVWLYRSQRLGERYELRRNPSRHGKLLSREEAEELIGLPGAVRIRHISMDGSVEEMYELGGPTA